MNVEPCPLAGRRRFLAGVAALPLAGLSAAAAAPAAARQPGKPPALDGCPAEMRERLSGPMPSLKTPFTRDGDVDYAGLRRLIDFNLAAGAKALMLTAGDSDYSALTEQEIAEVTRVTVEHTAGRALVIAADRYFNTRQAVAFAEYVRGIGADLLMVMPPDWAASSTPQTLADHYRAVSEQIPVMIVSNVFISRGARFGYDTLELTLDQAPNVVAIKDDMCGEFARKMSRLVHGRWAVISGGRKENHLNNHPYGCDGYLSTFLSIKPEISHAYWKAVSANDLAGMRRVIHEQDMPFFDLVGGLPGGFACGLHACLELKGIAGRWRRKPYYSLSDSELEDFGGKLTQLGLI